MKIKESIMKKEKWEEAECVREEVTRCGRRKAGTGEGTVLKELGKRS